MLIQRMLSVDICGPGATQVANPAADDVINLKETMSLNNYR